VKEARKPPSVCDLFERANGNRQKKREKKKEEVSEMLAEARNKKILL